MPKQNSDRIEVLIVGAGPVGLIVAKEVAERGIDVTVLEEHLEVGVPIHCAGLLSVRGLKEIGVSPSRKFIQNEVCGARFHSPSNLTFTIKAKETAAYVVDRSIFDKELADQIVRAGAQLRSGFQVKQLLTRDHVISGVVGTRGEVLKAKVVVDAEGVGFRLLKTVGMKIPNQELILPATQIEVSNIDVDPNYVDIFVGQNVAPGFFAWIIPTGADTAKIGLACKRASPRKLLKKFINDKVGKHRIRAVYAGQVLTCGPSPKTYHDGIIIVGDAAGQTKPTTGGGVITGGICARIAGRVAAEAVMRNDTSAAFLKKYEKEWKSRLGRDFTMMRYARKVLNQTSDKRIDELFKAVIENELTRDLEKGDLDFQGAILRRLALHPAILKTLLKTAHDLIFGYYIH